MDQNNSVRCSININKIDSFCQKNLLYKRKENKLIPTDRETEVSDKRKQMHINNGEISGNITILLRMMNRPDSRCNHRNVKFVYVVAKF